MARHGLATPGLQLAAAPPPLLPPMDIIIRPRPTPTAALIPPPPAAYQRRRSSGPPRPRIVPRPPRAAVGSSTIMTVPQHFLLILFFPLVLKLECFLSIGVVVVLVVGPSCGSCLTCRLFAAGLRERRGVEVEPHRPFPQGVPHLPVMILI
jgi:hypothetical protein